MFATIQTNKYYRKKPPPKKSPLHFRRGLNLYNHYKIGDTHLTITIYIPPTIKKCLKKNNPPNHRQKNVDSQGANIILFISFLLKINHFSF